VRRPGRPRLAPDDPSVNVHFRLPSKALEVSQRQAGEMRLTHAEWLRVLVYRAARTATVFKRPKE